MDDAASDATQGAHLSVAEWRLLLLPYAAARDARATAELAVTVAATVGVLAISLSGMAAAHGLAWLAQPVLALCIVRLFVIQHDCGHRAFFTSRTVNDWVGRAISVVTLTPYAYWRLQHAGHHATSGNLDRRGIGDIWLLTRAEYHASRLVVRLVYRAFRHPLVLFLIAPVVQFAVLYRVPLRQVANYRTDRRSILLTNMAILLVYTAIAETVGLPEFIAAFGPAALMAACCGLWLFYVQHQFLAPYWRRHDDWNYISAAMLGSSMYDLPHWLHWVTGNIGYHHVHHLWSRIPLYNLPRCHREVEPLRRARRLTIMASLRSVPHVLWDEQRQRLISFREAGSRGVGSLRGEDGETSFSARPSSEGDT